MKRISILIALVLLFAASNVYAGAPDRVGRPEIGILGGGAFNDSSVDDAGYIQAAWDWGVTPYIALGIEGGWQEGSGSFDAEDVGSVSILGDIILRNPDWHDNLVPYFVLGLGVIGQYVTDEDGGAPTNNGNDVDDTGFGVKVGGGLDWFINPNWVANFEVAWFGSDTDLPGSSAPGGVDYWTVGGGLKFVF
ncbi:MAG TPA: outer membrane beta-barrel protein [Candidatus Eisenbacteria bacterium]|jgi:opacity protein-like surface antigen|nr:outer membrane beta-barrel protein [Candidatus Eisenbacteria bacterium]